MASDTKIPQNVVHFPALRRRDPASDDGSVPTGGFGDHDDQGPSTDESLRLMRAFVRIKNRHLRADLVAMLEGASRTRRPKPARGKE